MKSRLTVPCSPIRQQLSRWGMALLALSASACGTLGEHQARHQAGIAPDAVARSSITRPSARAQSADLPYEIATGRHRQPTPFAPGIVESIPTESRIQLGQWGECPHGCPPNEICPTCSHNTLADHYPDEYLCDGGDRGQPVHYDGADMLGLETQDTVAEFKDGDKRRRVKPTNEVCIYSPRFSSVTVINGAIEDTHEARPLQSQHTRSQVALHNRTKAVTAKQDESAERMTSKVRGGLLVNVDRPITVDNDLKAVEAGSELVPIVAFGGVSANLSEQVQKGVTERRVQHTVHSALTQTPLTAAKDQAIQLVETKFLVEELAGKDVRGPGRLRIVKLANQKLASLGDEITFTIRYENSGDTPVEDVVIVDNLTPRLEYIDDSQTNNQAGEFATVDNGEGSVILRWELKEPLAPRTSAEITFKTRVR